MFSRFTRLPLRRCLHTHPSSHSQSFNRLGITLGASAAATATYLAWRLTSDSQSIRLDSATKLPPSHRSSQSPPPEPIPRPSALEPEAPFVKDSTLITETTSTTFEDSDGTAQASTTNAEGEAAPEDAGQGGAFNPVTGEINWDCPCLGGMAHGPCGAQFREAFSCFVFSEEEPKGINCVEKFKAMQDCFREHPDVYGDEIMDDDDDEPPKVPEGAEVITPETNTTAEPTLVPETNAEPVPVPETNAAPETTKPKPRKPPTQTLA
ncbi:hypothetical protein DXG03_003127 [Asterophora parasitica]|uniref:Mitochondrial intermembrane space import and assembly protein 40 n=1 Tax=Asterophora parasitica TaxID=117018 RepID=A0A9P7GEK2_9AGAR|nr:hypothetical protein DXG03_003127 [Asterophora parasitica]